MRLASGKPWLWVIALPILWGWMLVGLFGVNHVYWDEWRIVEELKAFRESGVHLAALYAQHNEHRIFLPRIALMATGMASGYNTKIHMCIGQLLVLVAYLCHIRFALRLSRGRSRGGLEAGLLLLIGFSCYNTMQYENFLWGFQIGFLMVLAFAVLAFYHLDRAVRDGGTGHVAGAVLAGVGASLSALHGLFVWPVFGALWVLASLSSEKISAKIAIPMLAAGAVSCAAYFIGYQKPALHPEYLDGGAWKAVAYFFAAAGGPGAARYALWAVALGVLVVAVTIVLGVRLVRTKQVQAYFFPLGLILFGYAVSASLAIGRAGLKDGVSGAMTSRYSTYGLLLYVGILLIVYGEYLLPASAAVRPGAGRKFCLGVVALLGACILAKNALYLLPARQWREDRMAGIAITRNYRNATWEQLRKVGPFADRAHALESIGILEEFKWGLFSPLAPAAKAKE